jgi:CheY-like chemotaxis protein
MINIKSSDYSRCATNKKIYKILLIDDDPTNANLFSSFLRSRGHEITIMDEGCRALYSIAKNNYDIIFMDYDLNNDGNNYFKANNLIECIQELDLPNLKLFILINDTNNYSIKEIKKNNYYSCESINFITNSKNSIKKKEDKYLLNNREFNFDNESLQNSLINGILLKPINIYNLTNFFTFLEKIYK